MGNAEHDFNQQLSDIKIAVCGDLTTACNALRDIGVKKIDKYTDALELAHNLRNGVNYHLVLVYAPQGEGLDTEYNYKHNLEGEWKSVPVRLLNEPACHSAIVELKSAVCSIANKQLGYG